MDKGKLCFREATLKDIEDIVQINASHLNKFHEDEGFLVNKLTYDLIKENISSFFCVFIRDEVVAYCRIGTVFPYDINHISVDYEDVGIPDLLQNHYIYISQVAVNSNHLHKGIGRFIYRSLFDIFKGFVFLSTVIACPHKNTASMKFHESCGFVKCGMISKDIIGDQIFESLLYCYQENRGKI